MHFQSRGKSLLWADLTVQAVLPSFNVLPHVPLILRSQDVRDHNYIHPRIF